MNKNDIASFNTRRKILEVARKKFEDKGFSDTSLQEIVGEIGLTRGAFYHHYKRKEDILFDLIKEIQIEIAKYIEKKAIEKSDPWEQLVTGCVAFVEKAMDKDIMKILLIDAPAIIPWDEWKKIDIQNSESHLKEQLKNLQLKGLIKKIKIDYLTSFISGGLNEMAVSISHKNDFNLSKVEFTVRLMLEGLRNNGQENKRLL